MGMQRHLKAIGIFARLHLRDDKSDYLNAIPRTLNYVIEVCGMYPQLHEFQHFLQQRILPAIKK
jgi:aminoglycoside/choline kinase family phosphotransferase